MPLKLGLFFRGPQKAFLYRIKHLSSDGLFGGQKREFFNPGCKGTKNYWNGKHLFYKKISLKKWHINSPSFCYIPKRRKYGAENRLKEEVNTLEIM